MIAPILTGVLTGLAKANLAAGAAVLVVLILRKPVRAWFGARAAYVLWLAPLAAAAAVLLPHPQIATPIGPMVLRAETAAASVADEFTVQAPDAARASGPDVQSLLFAAWLAGALAAGGLVLWRQARFIRSMGRLTASDTPRVYRAESPDVGPAVVGVFRPRIVAPSDFEARFGPQERALILTHEQVHLAGGDAGVNALACAAACVSWFNPLVHVAVRMLRIDQELACDASVVGRFPEARRAYAELLLKTQIATQPLPLGCHWPAGADHPLKERIAMLKSPLPAGAARALGLAIAAGLTLGVGGLAWAAQPAQAVPAAPAATTEALLAAVPNNGHLEPAEALKYWKPGLSFLCKPDERRELHNCRVTGSPFEAIATAADVQREWPAQAKAAGLTGMVTLQCTPNLVTHRLDQCVGYHFSGAAERPEWQADFERAAVRVISIIRLKAHPGADDGALSPRGFYSIPFDEHPALPGGPPVLVTRFPDFLPGPDGKPAAPAKVSEAAPQGHGKTLVSYAPGAYTPPPGFAEPRTNGRPQTAPFKSIWIKKPTGDDMVRLYPAEAAKARVAAELTLTCRVGGEGLLYDCNAGPIDLSADTVAAITPSTAGQFKSAGLALAALFQMDTTRIAEAAGTDRMIRIPIRFTVPQAPAPGAPS